MRSFLVVCLLLSAASLAGLTGCKGASSDHGIVPHKPSKHSSIVGGREVRSQDFSAGFAVLIFVEKENAAPEICTATFVGDGVLLTAAHCVSKDTQAMTLNFSTRPLEGDGGLSLAIDSVAIHEGYVPSTEDKKSENDLALIFMSRHLPKGARIMALPGAQDLIPAKSKVIAMGYGRTEGIEDSPNPEMGALREVELDLAQIRTQGNVIYVDQSKGRGVCYGDSGGPAYYLNEKKQPVILGVANAIIANSTNQDFCQNKSVYANIRVYTKWIREKIAAKSHAKP